MQRDRERKKQKSCNFIVTHFVQRQKIERANAWKAPNIVYFINNLFGNMYIGKINEYATPEYADAKYTPNEK